MLVCYCQLSKSTEFTPSTGGMYEYLTSVARCRLNKATNREVQCIRKEMYTDLLCVYWRCILSSQLAAKWATLSFVLWIHTVFMNTGHFLLLNLRLFQFVISHEKRKKKGSSSVTLISNVCHIRHGKYIWHEICSYWCGDNEDNFYLLCRLVTVYRHLKGTCFSIFKVFKLMPYPEDGSNSFLLIRWQLATRLHGVTSRKTRCLAEWSV